MLSLVDAYYALINLKDTMQQLPDFNTLRSFVILAEERNFRKTAERLAIDQSALTRRIQKLEHLLGVQLFERNTKGVDITPAGQAFVRKVRPLLLDYQTAIASAQKISTGETGSLRIAFMAFAAYRLMPMSVKYFGRQYPNIEMALQFMPTEQQKQAFAKRQIDIGFMYQMYQHSDYHCQRLNHEQLCVVAPKTHPLMQQQRILSSDLDGYPLIVGSIDKWRDYRIRLGELFRQADIEMPIVIEATNTLAMIGLVAAGMGLTIYPQSLAQFLFHDAIATKPIDDPIFFSETTLVWHKHTNNSSVARFVEVVNAQVLPQR